MTYRATPLSGIRFSPVIICYRPPLARIIACDPHQLPVTDLELRRHLARAARRGWRHIHYRIPLSWPEWVWLHRLRATVGLTFGMAGLLGVVLLPFETWLNATIAAQTVLLAIAVLARWLPDPRQKAGDRVLAALTRTVCADHPDPQLLTVWRAVLHLGDQHEAFTGTLPVGDRDVLRAYHDTWEDLIARHLIDLNQQLQQQPTSPHPVPDSIAERLDTIDRLIRDRASEVAVLNPNPLRAVSEDHPAPSLGCLRDRLVG